MQYKGYFATVEYDEEAKLFHGEVLNTRDIITFQGTSVDELEHAFKASVDDYLAFCKHRGEEPDKPFSGKFPIRTTPELHKRIAAAAKRCGKSVNAWVCEQLDRATG